MSKPNRRCEFLSHTEATGAAALVAPAFVPAAVLGRNGQTLPSEQITLGSLEWDLGVPTTNRDFGV